MGNTEDAYLRKKVKDNNKNNIHGFNQNGSAFTAATSGQYYKSRAKSTQRPHGDGQ